MNELILEYTSLLGGWFLLAGLFISWITAYFVLLLLANLLKSIRAASKTPPFLDSIIYELTAFYLVAVVCGGVAVIVFNNENHWFELNRLQYVVYILSAVLHIYLWAQLVVFLFRSRTVRDESLRVERSY